MIESFDNLDLNSLTTVLPEGMAMCACNKMVPVEFLKKVDVGSKVEAYDNICNTCTNNAELEATTARLVCVKCRRTVARLPIGTDGKGFTIEPGKSYHCVACAYCTEGHLDCVIIEKVAHDRKIDNK